MLITEGDALGNSLLEGIVLLDNLAVVPVPAALWLLAGDLAVLVPAASTRQPSAGGAAAAPTS